MKSQIDLDKYLTKYGQQATTHHNFNQSKSRSRPFHDTSYDNISSQPQFQQPSPHFQPQSQPHQTFYNTFTRSQNQCLQQLQQTRRGLLHQQKQLSFFLQNHSKKLYDNLLIEHARIKQQILEMVDKVFYESEKRIADLVMKENTNEPLEFISIRKRIQQINQRIDELSAMLRGDHYRKAIADVVTSDFEGEIRGIEGLRVNAQNQIMGNSMRLVLDQGAFGRVKEEIERIISLEGTGKRAGGNSVHNASGLNQTGSMNERRPSKGRLGLFETAPQQKEGGQGGGGFFNFGSN